LSDASKLLKEFSKSGLDDAACFSSTLARLEADIDHMRVRANAWAIGDIEVIRKLDYNDHEGTCRAALEGSAAFQSRPDLRERAPRRVRYGCRTPSRHWKTIPSPLPCCL
jgi:hypothetical protein